MDARSVTVRETVNARAVRIERQHLKTLFHDATRIVASRGQKSVVLDLAQRDPGGDEVAKHVLGRSETLRAPAAHVGTTWLVGFNEEAWEDVLG